MNELESVKCFGVPRSDKWSSVRAEWLKNNPICSACGSKDNLEVHHVIAFHTDMSKELDTTNFITLCEGMDRNCHRFIGHLNNYQSINSNSRVDAKEWLDKISHRPKWNGTEWINQ
jgi:transposase-like protein